MKTDVLFKALGRRDFLKSAAAALLALSLGIVPAAYADKDDDHDRDHGRQHWVATWATSPAAYFVYVAPLPQNQVLALAPTRFTTANIQPDLAFLFPNANIIGANNQTIRSIIKSDLWGTTMRVRFSNVFGNQSLTFDSATLALQEYAGNVVHGTVTVLTFGRSRSVTIP